MSDSVQPHRQQPNRLPRPWDSPGKNTGVGCHFLLQHMKVKSESEVAQSCQLLVTPWTAAHQASPFMGFSRQEYWSGVPLPSPSLRLAPPNKLNLLRWEQTEIIYSACYSKGQPPPRASDKSTKVDRELATLYKKKGREASGLLW